jgi:hypothetical protein
MGKLVSVPVGVFPFQVLSQLFAGENSQIKALGVGKPAVCRGQNLVLSGEMNEPFRTQTGGLKVDMNRFAQMVQVQHDSPYDSSEELERSSLSIL